MVKQQEIASKKTLFTLYMNVFSLFLSILGNNNQTDHHLYLRTATQ